MKLANEVMNLFEAKKKTTEKEAKEIVGKDDPKASKQIKALVKDLNRMGFIASASTEETIDYYDKKKLDKGFNEITFQEEDDKGNITFFASGGSNDDFSFDANDKTRANDLGGLASWLKGFIK